MLVSEVEARDEESVIPDLDLSVEHQSCFAEALIGLSFQGRVECVVELVEHTSQQC